MSDGSWGGGGGTKRGVSDGTEGGVSDGIGGRGE